MVVVRRGDGDGSEEPGLHGPGGVTVSTLDSESSDRGSNPREAFLALHVTNKQM